MVDEALELHRQDTARRLERLEEADIRIEERLRRLELMAYKMAGGMAVASVVASLLGGALASTLF